MRYLQRGCGAVLVTVVESNAYHLANLAARLIGIRALQDATRFDPVALETLIVEYEVTSTQ